MRPRSASEVKEVLEVERAGLPFLLHRDGDDAQQLNQLRADMPLLTIGRHSSCDIALPWDSRVSRTHAVLERLGQAWTIIDDGLSRNGTYLNAVRLTTRKRLVDGDTLRVGATVLVFRHPVDGTAGATNPDDPVVAVPLTPMQNKVLVALCRPVVKAGVRHGTPASNSEIAEELFLSVGAVKTHLRGLFERFSVGELQQNQKRGKVVERALSAGMVSERDL
jgi:pSer/pThr/pTyr-binding forkhead associated (FHA) protein